MKCWVRGTAIPGCAFFRPGGSPLNVPHCLHNAHTQVLSPGVTTRSEFSPRESQRDAEDFSPARSAGYNAHPTDLSPGGTAKADSRAREGEPWTIFRSSVAQPFLAVRLFRPPGSPLNVPHRVQRTYAGTMSPEVRLNLKFRHASPKGTPKTLAQHEVLGTWHSHSWLCVFPPGWKPLECSPLRSQRTYAGTESRRDDSI